MDKNRIEKVYSGKPGCTCGCRGRYSDRPASITRIYNIMMKNINKVEIKDEYAFLDEEDHLYIIYFKEEK